MMQHIAQDHAAIETAMPAHAQVYLRLREMVLYGDLTPGQAVTIQGLTERLGVGMTPVREAIRRLISQGALEFQGNRRVSVPLLTAADIGEIIVAREWLDRRAARARSPLPAEESRRRLLIRRSHVATISAAWIVTVPATGFLGAMCCLLILRVTGG